MASLFVLIGQSTHLHAVEEGQFRLGPVPDRVHTQRVGAAADVKGHHAVCVATVTDVYGGVDGAAHGAPEGTGGCLFTQRWPRVGT